MRTPLFPASRFAPVLIADDDPPFLHTSVLALRDAGIERVHTISDGRGILPLLAGLDDAVVVLDLDMPHRSGLALFFRILEEHPQNAVIVTAKNGGPDTALHCMMAGAFDYLPKPLEPSCLVASVLRAVERRELEREISNLRGRLLNPLGEEEQRLYGIVTRSRNMKTLFHYTKAIAASSHPVLITGETGVGKELIAQAVHGLSGREGAFVPVNVAGLDDMIFSDTMFGHVKGAYTGAGGDRKGMIAQACGGTLFLDEIGDLEIRSQVKLLRLLERGEYRALGSDDPVKSDARILCATQHDLRALVASGRFRNDLYFRLHTHHIDVLPLREHREDLPLLVDHYLEEAARSLGKRKPTPPPELLRLLSTYQFPGNVRELRAMIFDAVAMHRSGVLSLERIRRVIEERRPSRASVATAGSSSRGFSEYEFPVTLPTLKEAEERLIAEALRRAGNNQRMAALMLGLTREALNRRLARKRKLARGIPGTEKAA